MKIIKFNEIRTTPNWLKNNWVIVNNKTYTVDIRMGNIIVTDIPKKFI